MLTFEIALVFAVVIFLVIVLYREVMPAATAFVIVIVILLLGKVISPGEALAGFANEQLGIIILLLIISKIFQNSGVLNSLFIRVFKETDSPRKFLLKMVSSVGIGSTFLNNTPLVAIMMPYTFSWSEKKGVAASKFLIPLSFASIIGGCVTLIGTSTNLIVNGLAVEAGAESLEMFDFAYAGLPLLVVGTIYLYTYGYKILPERQSAKDQFITSSRSFFIELVVEDKSPLIGKSVQEGGLRQLKDIYLVEIIRGPQTIKPVNPEEILEKGDKLLFAGNTSAVSDILKPKLGLSLPKAVDLKLNGKQEIVEVVISHQSKLTGKKVKDTDFRATFDGAILAIHRNGEKISGKIGGCELRAGDVLLVLAGNDFYSRIENNPNFYQLSSWKTADHHANGKALILFGGLILAIALSATGLVPLFIGLSVLLAISLLARLTEPNDIRKGLDYGLIIIIALGITLGKAVINSGAADLLSHFILEVALPIGAIGLLAVIFLITNLLSAIITSKAAVALILPVSMVIAAQIQAPLEPFILIIAYGGAANFITPIGYQTNLMVYGPGGYSFKDFFRVGLPLTILYLAGTVSILAWVYNLW